METRRVTKGRIGRHNLLMGKGQTTYGNELNAAMRESARRVMRLIPPPHPPGLADAIAGAFLDGVAFEHRSAAQAAARRSMPGPAED